jgi:hypothetical protein
MNTKSRFMAALIVLLARIATAAAARKAETSKPV